MDREEAIRRLRLGNLNATKRDWALGASIAVPFGEPQEADGIIVFPDCCYLYPRPDGCWEHLHVADGVVTCYDTLDLAVEALLNSLLRPTASR
ncbi:hypothetical protein HL666_17895 [Bradyrhizobium sp. 83002]|uniref:hypothetical protein n=1 Tax=Bradyrhizobium aeschynomenes TaxID=2734909 RepID=UPI00155831B5|nr:hypothetical protein [Bradyrhizobium aeschynomenes]NPU12649.1 hypothetical protein [Bradyrhizobium aeschynomenes]